MFVGYYVRASNRPHVNWVNAEFIVMALHFWLFIPFLLVSFVITAVYLKNTFQQSDRSTDIFSLLLSTIGFGGIVIGTSLASNLGWLSLPVAACLIVGIVAVELYLARQTHLATPVLNVSVFKSKAFSIGTAMVI